MTINGKTGSFARSEEKFGLPGHGPVLLGVKLTASAGIYPLGLVLTRNSADVALPLQEVADEVLGTGGAAATAVAAEVLGAGDGTKTFFSGFLANNDIEPGSVEITATVGAAPATMADDGAGKLSGAAGAGTIDYATGMYILVLDTAADNATNLTGDYSHTPATKTFAATLAAALPVHPGSVSVTDGVETFTDDGAGRLVGSAGGSGTIDYKSGKVIVTFNTAVVDATDVTADYITSPDAVLDEEVDTAASGSGNAVTHGTGAKEALKVGVVAKAAPSAALLKALRKNGIYPI